MKDKSVLPATFNDGIVFIGQRDRDQLVVQARSNMIGRARICTHTSDKSPVQEMVIAFTRETYVHPHRHIEKSESFHVIEGELAVVFFDDSGCRLKARSSRRHPDRPPGLKKALTDWIKCLKKASIILH